MRWRLRLGEFNFTVKHEKGRLNKQADMLSRLPITGGTTLDIDEYIPCYTVEALDVELEEDDEGGLDNPCLNCWDALDSEGGDAILIGSRLPRQLAMETPEGNPDLLNRLLGRNSYATSWWTRSSRRCAALLIEVGERGYPFRLM